MREDIEQALDRPGELRHRLIVTPMLDRRSQLGPASLDLRLGTEFIEIQRHREGSLDPMSLRRPASHADEAVSIGLGERVVLHPGQFVLGSTLEFVHLPPDLAGQVLSRSSWGRVGLVVATAVTLQPGWTGMVTLELANQGSVPIALYPGLRVAQLVLWSAAEPTNHAYDVASTRPKYRKPLGPEASRLVLETDELERLRRVASRLGEHPAQPRPPDNEPP